MSRNYGTVDTGIWRHQHFKALPDDAKLMAMYLRTCDHGNMLGCFHLPIGYMMGDLKWTEQHCLNTVSALSVHGFAKYCSETEFVLIPKHLEKFPLQNESVATGAMKCWRDIPHAFSYFHEITEILHGQEKVSAQCKAELTEALTTVPTRCRVPYPDPDPEPVPEQEKRQTRSASPPKPVLKTRKGKSLSGASLDRFECFWAAFNYKRGKAEAADAWIAFNPDDDLTARIVAAAQAEAKRRPSIVAAGMTPKMAQGWLTAQRWEDEHPPAIPTPNPRNGAGGYVINGKTYRLPPMTDDVACCKLAEELGVSLRGLERRTAHDRLRAELERRAS